MDIAISKLNEIVAELKKIKDIRYADQNLFDRLAERAKAIATSRFGPESELKENIEGLQKQITNSFTGFRLKHIQDLIGLVQIIIDAIELSSHQEQKPQLNLNREMSPYSKTPTSDNSKVFIVHGHNDAMKLATARTIEKLGLKPIILHEQANIGDTIIEKFTRNSEVGFAIALLSADDLGYSKTQPASAAKLRARQNVIFELGFFYAKLGRKKVVALFEEVPGFEKPSDIDGIVYIPYHANSSEWQFKLVQELSEIGYLVDANALIR